MKKFLERISDVREIYFIGFNLKDQDSPDKLYFQRIFEILPNVKVYIDEFCKNDEKSIKNTLKEWGLKNYHSIEFIKTCGEEVKKGDVIMILYGKSSTSLDEASFLMKNAFKFSHNKPNKRSIIYETIF